METTHVVGSPNRNRPCCGLHPHRVGPTEMDRIPIVAFKHRFIKVTLQKVKFEPFVPKGKYRADSVVLGARCCGGALPAAAP